MRLLGIILLGVVFLSSCGKAPKIAYANNKELFDGFELTKELTAKLEEKKIASQLVLDSLKLELVSLKKQIESLEEPDAAMLKQHQLLYNEYLTKETSFSESHEQLAIQYDEQIMKQLNEYIKLYGEEQELDLLLGAGDGNLLYAPKGIDVTQGLINYSNSKYQGK